VLALLLMLPFSLNTQALPSHVGVQALLQALLINLVAAFQIG
jgi:hypothetical protein